MKRAFFKRFLSILLSTAILLSLGVNLTFAAEDGETARLYGKIETELASIARDVVSLGITEDMENLSAGARLPAYTVKDGALEPTDTWYYPILDGTGKPVLMAAAYLLEGEREISLSTTFVDDLSACTNGKRLALIYELGGVSLLVNGTARRILSSPDNAQLGYGDLSAVSQAALSSASAAPLSAAVALTLPPMPLGLDDEEFYMYVDKIMQPEGSGICWAACIASVVNYIKKTSYTSTQVAELCGVTDFYDSATNRAGRSAKETLNYMSNKFGITYTLVESDRNNYKNIIASFTANYPVFGFFIFQYVNNWGNIQTTGHAVVIRGLSFKDNMFYYMDPVGGNYCFDGRFSGTGDTRTATVYFWGGNYMYTLHEYGYKA